MTSNSIFMLTVVGLGVLVLFVLVFLVAKFNSTGNKNAHVKNAKTVDIYTYIKIVSDESSSALKIQNAIDEVVKSYPFPKKKEIKAPLSARPYLDFIFRVVCNKNSNAKLIAYMNKELKKANPDYRDEIDTYEEKGIRARRQ